MTATAPARVLWLTKGLGRGGAETLLVSLAEAIDPREVQLSVAYVLPHKDALVPALESAGVTTTMLGGRGRRGEWVSELRSLLATTRPDVVHTHAPVVGAAARVVAPRGQVLVHTEHNTWGRYRRPTRWANAVTIRRNRIVWAVSEGVATSIRPFGSRRGSPHVEVMLHGIDPRTVRRGAQARASARRVLGVTEDDFVFGTVGNLTPKKNHDSMLRAFRGVRASHPHARLFIIGTGPQEQHLRRVITDLGLGERAILFGSRDDVNELLPGFDAFVLSSLHEGLSIALVEALAAGLPVVATRVGGIPEVIRHRVDGLLVPARDERALSDGMQRLMDDTRLRESLAAAGVTRAEAFTIEPAARALTAAYQQLAGATRHEAVDDAR